MVGGIGRLHRCDPVPDRRLLPGLYADLCDHRRGVRSAAAQEADTAAYLIAIAIVQLGCGLLIDTYWISVLYGSPFTALLVTRSVQCLIMIPVEFIVIGAMSRLLAAGIRQALRRRRTCEYDRAAASIRAG